MAIMNLFMGVPQSKYAALAILAAIAIVSLTILFGREPIPLSQKFAFVLLVFLMSAPGILLTLFQLTCMVTGSGFNNKRWWCSAYSWIISGLLILYCVFLIAMAVTSLASGEMAVTQVAKETSENFETKMNAANQMATDMLNNMLVQSPQEDNSSDSEHLNPFKPKKKVPPHTFEMADLPRPMATKGPNQNGLDMFSVQGGASVPAGVEPTVAPMPPTEVKNLAPPSAVKPPMTGDLPEAFEDAEAFSTCGAPF